MDKNKIESPENRGLSMANVFVFLAIISLITAVILFGISLTKKYQLSSTEKKLTDAKNELRSLKSSDEKAMVAAAAVENYDSLNDQKNYWSVFLNEISSKALINSKINELSMVEESGVLNIEGTVRTYEDLSKFMVSLRSSAKIEKVTLMNASLDATAGQGGVSFALEVVPASGAFTPNSLADISD